MSSNGRGKERTSVLTRQHANTPQSATRPQKAAAHLMYMKHFSFFFPFKKEQCAARNHPNMTKFTHSWITQLLYCSSAPTESPAAVSLHQAEELGGMFCNTSSRLGHTRISTLQRWEKWEYSELSLPLVQQRKQHMNLGKKSNITHRECQTGEWRHKQFEKLVQGSEDWGKSKLRLRNKGESRKLQLVGQWQGNW